jgi:hypothetical protein
VLETRYQEIKEFVKLESSRQLAVNLLTGKINEDEMFIFIELDQNKVQEHCSEADFRKNLDI